MELGISSGRWELGVITTTKNWMKSLYWKKSGEILFRCSSLARFRPPTPLFGFPAIRFSRMSRKTSGNPKALCSHDGATLRCKVEWLYTYEDNPYVLRYTLRDIRVFRRLRIIRRLRVNRITLTNMNNLSYSSTLLICNQLQPNYNLTAFDTTFKTWDTQSRSRDRRTALKGRAAISTPGLTRTERQNRGDYNECSFEYCCCDRA